MCFYECDGEWSAEVEKVTHEIATDEQKCVECKRKIVPGEWCQKSDAWEEDRCRICDEFGEDYDEENPQDPETCDHDYGEEWHAHTCVGCLKILAGIYAVEADEDCPEWARQPQEGMLWDELIEHGSASLYANRALKMYPELAGHPIIDAALAQPA